MAVVLNRFVGGLVSLFDRIWAYRSWRYVAYALLFIIAVTEPMYPMWGKGMHKQLGDISGSIINVGVRQTFIRLPYPSFHKKDGHNHTHPIQSKRRNPIERMMNYVQLQLYRKNV